MKIGIDARFTSTDSGIGRYERQFIPLVVKQLADIQFVIFVLPDSKLSLTGNNIQIVELPYRWYSWQEQLILPWIYYKFNLDLLHVPHFNVPWLYRKKIILTIHDLILFDHPDSQATTRNKLIYYIKYRLFKLFISSAIKRAQQIITVSQFSADDIIKHWPKVRNQIQVIHLASNYAVEKPNSLSRDKTLLYVGNSYPHKNLKFLIQAFCQFRANQPDFKLLIVGNKDYFSSQLNLWVGQNFSTEAQEHIQFIFNLTDDELHKLYLNSFAFVTASLHEGFGLPGLEAMSLGLPVLSSNATCLPEIYGQAAQYFEPKDAASFVRAASELTNMPQLYSDLIDRGLARANEYSWQLCANQTAEVYLLDKK